MPSFLTSVSGLSYFKTEHHCSDATIRPSKNLAKELAKDKEGVVQNPETRTHFFELFHKNHPERMNQVEAVSESCSLLLLRHKVPGSRVPAAQVPKPA
ncbi:hypothetical protein FZEAL_5873 [Fusarium zealandicum]|uniref:Uncharacterized protein n=1 Tax=Fusarium zealandicum TaxID=1053134 RepID=A0A8H4XK57_9HYPO|nr:hypothetical protein FZEAL_5873 [Fusarium zealandicum]